MAFEDELARARSAQADADAWLHSGVDRWRDLALEPATAETVTAAGALSKSRGPSELSLATAPDGRVYVKRNRDARTGHTALGYLFVDGDAEGGYDYTTLLLDGRFSGRSETGLLGYIAQLIVSAERRQTEQLPQSAPMKKKKRYWR